MIQEKGEGGLKGYTYNLIFNISRIMAGDGGWVGNNKADSLDLIKRSQLPRQEYEAWWHCRSASLIFKYISSPTDWLSWRRQLRTLWRSSKWAMSRMMKMRMKMTKKIKEDKMILPHKHLILKFLMNSLMLKLKHQLRYFDGLGWPIIIVLSQKIGLGFLRNSMGWTEVKNYQKFPQFIRNQNDTNSPCYSDN